MKPTLLLAPILFLSSTNDPDVTRFEAPEGPRSEDVRALLHASGGELWVGTHGGGVSSFDGKRWTHIAEEQLGMTGAASILQDANEALWFCGRKGVTRFDGKHWQRFEEELGREVRVAFSGFAEEDGSVWFATNAGAVRFDGESWDWITTENGLLHDVVHDITRDRRGDLWFATRRGGLSRRSADGAWEHFHARDNVRAILEDAAGSLWFGTGGGGVLSFDGEEWTRHHPGRTVLPLFEDSRGNVWFSHAGKGALRVRAGNWTEHKVHVPEGEIHSASEDGERGIWFGADSGLVRLRKRAG